MTDPTTSAVRTEHVWKTFHQEAEEIHAVRDVTIEIARGEFTALAGPSGSGKTTLLNVIGGLTRPSRGQVWVAGRNLTEMSNPELARLRLGQVGFVFQAYNLLPVLTAMENAEFPMLLQGIDPDERAARVGELFKRIGLDGMEGRRPRKLSGGQQQRVAVVRSVASKPALVLADEPTANLDSAASDALLDVMRELNEDLGITFVFATHDTRVMERCRRLVRMVDGAIESDKVRS
ncbi:MAG: ABC transporter ATP-binding protein [Vicinamibacterales bacterium]|jgi:putative ABC transport system ATP-binding protein|nr:macrolide ABC transporter ATP-binding protein [Acidobacteriota bacterium]MDP7294464.1 ABC transporter ATP-binding protein [Vicinamibacterales bacterium]MDP7471906.1 ABC transporter ATP-binding protein [Vicinamibacterales bacterium]MDP7672302.1 ABC transporter ATP-binding protein [Vicinamibacterales bacterium]HJO37931.1 ABC transporter ATP-binding protein [Vicinamibacterales bacterium]|tara:strand:- start:5942 stop:6643 length:702 start_codon:yes stop_codon:yes gene_type:complete